MEIRKIIPRILIIAGIILCCYLLQVCVFSKLPICGVTPNILLGITSIFGFTKGRKRGIAVGFACGLLLDLSSDLLLGGMAAVFTTIGYINGYFKKLFFGDDITLPMMLIFSSSVIYGGVMYLVVLVTKRQFDFWYYFSSVIMPEAIYTVLVCIVIYYIIYQLSNKIDGSDNRKESHIGAKY